MKKSYNPLKLAGSYIGGVIGIIFSTIFLTMKQSMNTLDYFIGFTFDFFGSNNIKFLDLPNLTRDLCDGNMCVSVSKFTPLYFIYFILIVIMFFLIGYGIHLLIRAIRK